MTEEKTKSKKIDLRYDADSEKIFSFPIPFGKQTVRIEHSLGVLKDSRYLKWQMDSDLILKKALAQNNWKTEQYRPKVELWDEIALGVRQLGEKWKERSKWPDKVNAINLLFHAQVENRPEADGDSDEVLDANFILPEDNTFDITLWVLHGGFTLEEWQKMVEEETLPDWVTPDEVATIQDLVSRGFIPNMYVPTIHSFREETKAEVDEYLAINLRQNKSGRLASAAKSKKPEDSDYFRKIELYDSICIKQEGYKSRIPYIHKLPVIESFFAQQLARMGKLQLS